MSKQRRLLPVLAAAAGGLAAAAFLPVALAHADDCSLFECTLVSGGNPTDVCIKGSGRVSRTGRTPNRPTLR